MTLVRLIVTGEVEYTALGAFLKRAFPAVDFEPEKVNSFTCNRVHPRPEAPNAMLVVDKFATRIIASIDPGRKRSGPIPDYVVAIDDLELCNLDQPRVVVNAVREAVKTSVARMWASGERQKKCLERLRQCASFHLFSPMLESYFFTDTDALAAAGVHSPGELVPGQDIENFAICDKAYLARFASFEESEPDEPLRPQTKTWFAKHPKWYLKHLIEKEGGYYYEARQSIQALTKLSPTRALEIAAQRRFLRSLIRDLADGLNIPFPPQFAGDCHPETSRHAHRDRVLRNI